LHEVAPCPAAAPPECSLEELTLHANQHVVGGTSFHQAHGDLVAGAAGRRRMAPGVDALHINWRFAGAAHVRAARLRLYHLGGAGLVLLWTKAITWDAGQCPTIGGTPFSGRLDDHGPERQATGAQAVAIVRPPNADFPTDHLNVQRAPYKLEMTITSVDGAAVRTRTRFIYVDVEVADIDLSLGPERILTARAAHGVAVDPFIGFDRRNRELRAAMEQSLSHAPSVLAADDAEIAVPLDGSLFGARDAEWDDNTFFAAWRDRWRDGPYVPLVSRVRVYDAAGQRVSARLALGGARFLWDWEGAGLDLTDVHALSRDDLQTAYMFHLGQWTTGGWNTPTAYGGKRGAGAVLFRHADAGYQHYANGGARHFPFRMHACAHRSGAVFSDPRTDDDDYGSHTGVIFTPSRIARDRYTLTVYFAYGDEADWDVDSTAAELRAALPHAVPSATSGRMTVQRVVRISRWWRLNDSVQRGNFAWDNVAADLRRAGLTLDATAVTNPTDIDQGHFRNAFQAELAQLPGAKRCIFAPRDEQAVAGRGYGLRLRDHDGFRDAVQGRYGARVNALSALGRVQNGGDAHALDRIQARAELYLELVGQAGLGQVVEQTIDQLGRPQAWASTGALTTWLDPQLQMLLPAPPRGAIDGIVAAILRQPTAGGDRTATRELIRLTGTTSDNYKDRANDLANGVLQRICATISAQDAPDEDGLQVFQFDFDDNFDQFSASGWAFDTPSNRNRCPECDSLLAPADRANRQCPSAACGVRLRSNAAIMTLIPWRYMTGFQVGVLMGLQANKAKYFVLTNMEGTRPEILVVHEMGHHLCLPHSPHGFRMPNPVPGGAVWRMLRLAILNDGVRQQLIDGTVPGGNVAAYHAANHDACIMGYNFAKMPSLHYCFKCTLRLRGWDGDHVRNNL
ncbi:MAG: hypothetical protein KDK70_23300, partial [Myxococcales bacterium]|nr:hypothetical protein [Myxococcales bacterium]